MIKKVFRFYSDRCFEKCKKNVTNLEENICWIINTGEYCKGIIGGIHDTLSETIDEIYADSIDFADEEEVFSKYSIFYVV